MEKDFLLVPVDAQNALLLDFGLMGIRPVLQAMDDAMAWLREAKKSAPHTVVPMLNNGLRMDVGIKAALARHQASPDNVYYGSLESFTEHCGMTPVPGWTQPLNDVHNAFTLLFGGGVRLSVALPQELGGQAVAVDIPAGFFANVQRHLNGK